MNHKKENIEIYVRQFIKKAVLMNSSAVAT